MNDISFDTLARGAQAPQGRRFAVKAFGLAALAAAAAAPLVAEAGNNNGQNNKNKNNNKNRRKNRKQGRDEQQCPPEDCTAEAQQAAAAACQAQVALCEQEVRVICDRQSNDAEDLQECLDELLPCCASLGTCNVTAFFACVAPPPDPNE